MSLPSFLLVEVRAAFRYSARQHTASRRCPYSSTAFLLARSPPPRNPSLPPARKPQQDASAIEPARRERLPKAGERDAMGLVPRDHERRSLDTGRKVEVPTRVLPKAELAPNVKLSPMQRLHIEHLTRHPPPKKPPKRTSYHQDYFAELTSRQHTRKGS